MEQAKSPQSRHAVDSTLDCLKISSARILLFLVSDKVSEHEENTDKFSATVKHTLPGVK